MMKLDEFRLETYEQRHVLMLALDYLPASYLPQYGASIHALKVNLSRTQCREGGCEYCGGGVDA